MTLRLEEENKRIIVHVPMTIKKWGGRKVIVGPIGQDLRTLESGVRKDNKLLKAIARAYKWQKWITTDKYKNLDEIAEVEGINKSYVLRIIRLMRLSPKIIEAVLDGRQPNNFGLSLVEKSFPELWEKQEEMFGFK